MPNWYNKEKEPPTSRYTGTMSANIQIPANDSPEAEQEYAYEVLNETLRNATPASNAGVDITINSVERFQNV